MDGNVTAQPTQEPSVPTPGIGAAPNYQPPAQPEPQPQPSQQEPAPQPTPQPEPQPAPQPSEPTPQPQPSEPQPQPQAQQPQPQQLSYDEYLEQALNSNPAPIPKATEINGEDPEALNKFFEDFAAGVVKQAEERFQQREAVRNIEAQAWKEVFTKYPEIEGNAELRETVHNIRMGAYATGKSLSPLQVADALVGTLHNEYRRGINDNQVQTRVQASQPLGGNGQPVPEPKVNLEALQQPGVAGFDSAVQQIQAMIDTGKI